MRRAPLRPWLLALALLAPRPTAASDLLAPPPALPAGARSSPFASPAAGDTVFVVDQGPALDAPCRFRADGPLVLDVPIGRYAGPTNPDGTLRDAAALVADGLLSTFATLEIVAYDVDAAGPGPAEDDRVLFNGTPVHTLAARNPPSLHGTSNAWALTTVAIPIGSVKFPGAPGVAGAPPTAAHNLIEIRVDAGVLAAAWCVAVDWVALRMRAMSPIILIHGNSSSGHIFAPSPPANRQPAGLGFQLPVTAGQGFTQSLDARKLVWDNSVNLNPATSVAKNGAKLKVQLPNIARQLGVTAVHLVAHSKGGLDTRDWLQHHNTTLTVVSFTTLSTPHDGSALADALLARKSITIPKAQIEWPNPPFPNITATIAEMVEVNDGYPDLQAKALADFKEGNITSLRRTLAIDTTVSPRASPLNALTADMDVNGNAVIDPVGPNLDEYAALRAESTQLQDLAAGVARAVLNAVYQVLKRVTAVEVAFVKDATNQIRKATLQATTIQRETRNDSLVTISSGFGDREYGRAGSYGTLLRHYEFFDAGSPPAMNHSSVCGPAAATTVIPWLIDADQQRGGLR